MIYLVIMLVIIALMIIIFLLSKQDIRMRGVKITGSVLDISSRTWTDQYGVAHINYYIIYEFYDRNGQRWTGEKKVNSHRLAVGDSLTVYYLPNRPQRNDADL